MENVTALITSPSTMLSTIPRMDAGAQTLPSSLLTVSTPHVPITSYPRSNPTPALPSQSLPLSVADANSRMTSFLSPLCIPQLTPLPNPTPSRHRIYPIPPPFLWYGNPLHAPPFALRLAHASAAASFGLSLPARPLIGSEP